MAEPLKRQQASYRNPTAGDPAPWFTARGTEHPAMQLAAHGGRYILLGFFGSAADDQGRAALEIVRQSRNLFDDRKLMFFGVTWSPNDHDQGLIKQESPGIRYFLDYDGAVGQLYGVLPIDIDDAERFRYSRRRWFVLDPQLRIIGIFPFKQQGTERAELLKFLGSLPPVDNFAGFEMPIPVLAVPFVFEPDLCQRLIAAYDAEGGQRTGVSRDIDGRSVRVLDDSLKRRSDVHIRDPVLIEIIQDRIARRIFPEIEKIHFMKCTRTERYIVGCYDSADHGFFRPHRDNTSKGSAHRRFAASINLNADFEGGELNFPEYGSKWLKLPPGAAVIFSTPLMHQVSPVTRGRRYAFLPFLYDDEGAKIRERNVAFVGDGNETYSANLPEDN
jgi:predicted 2-oxoglutarate/Fe(II)-dependent dioxygenase YbiX/peroxiredoxin